MGGGGAVPNYKYKCNKPESEFLTGQVEYLWSCERLGSCLAVEHSMMKSSTLFHVFECGPLPPYVHLASTRRHSRDRCSQAFPAFRALPLPCIILNANRRTNNRGGLGTRLELAHIVGTRLVTYKLQTFTHKGCSFYVLLRICECSCGLWKTVSYIVIWRMAVLLLFYYFFLSLTTVFPIMGDWSDCWDCCFTDGIPHHWDCDLLLHVWVTTTEQQLLCTLTKLILPLSLAYLLILGCSSGLCLDLCNLCFFLVWLVALTISQFVVAHNDWEWQWSFGWEVSQKS